MNDYKELIVHIAMVMALEDECGQKELADMLEKAADAIEQLSTKCRQLEKERDALIADLKQASKIPYGGCHLCKSIRTEICKECYRSDMFSEIAKNPTDRWEWRGVQNEVLNNG